MVKSKIDKINNRQQDRIDTAKSDQEHENAEK